LGNKSHTLSILHVYLFTQILWKGALDRLFLKTGSHYVVQAGLKLTIFLSQPSECWDYRCVSPYPAANRPIFRIGNWGSQGFLVIMSDNSRVVVTTHISESVCFYFFFFISYYTVKKKKKPNKPQNTLNYMISNQVGSTNTNFPWRWFPIYT
jgi:hypothetical protein